MKKIILLTFLHSLIFVNISCQSLLTQITAKRSIGKDIKVLYNNSTSQTLVFIRMKHVGKKGYFESIKKNVDSLRAEGFAIYYEGIDFEKGLLDFEKDNYSKKFRKLVGYDISYTKDNNSLPKFVKKYELQNEHDYGIRKGDVNLDLSLKQIIDSTESKYGKIILSDCDIKTPLNEKYLCKNKTSHEFFISTYFREPYIIESIKRNTNKKIVLLYGKQHYTFMLPSFNKIGYKLIEN